ncbi:maltooligosyl trehalose synthase [Leifsonia xyli subsp. xyli]|uniref:Malto-oligosyl trehalose synthase n=2 Tax=Leifsonia xyli subsp. xyli TaxID=59736 RepID=Q6AH72_LEIXX|nr:malto-oligosyltrehalose synthase [Leifsonia xyli]AAT88273.1 malto-oligosyl trehalose synthase [Leifsonia xyli subsp. xyli str. CTCB07]ODA90172.1 maltooligosyl trehalose synthase [Leifsonia xyli subsp. xyli]
MSTDLPRNTYRLQIAPEFTLRDAAQVLGQLARLGVDGVYLSPLLQAEPGSAHGYDVTDPTRVDAERGGPDGLHEFADAAHARGIRVIVDIVPNHLGVATPANTAWWWDVLAGGPEARHAGFFDIDWAFGGGRVRIPVLGEGADELGTVRVQGGELRYGEHRFPIATGTEGGSPREVHERQHYELVSWRRADAELNYRRFFAVNTFAGVRVEDPRVFEETHREIGRWLREGLVDGLRVDHPDGLRDPGAYLKRLAELADGKPVWVEKILEGDERIPAWPISGTTGYDALGAVDRVFIDPSGEEPLTALAEEVDDREESRDWSALVHRRKRSAADGILRSEVLRVTRELTTAGATADPGTLADAVAELAAAFPVYRSYLPFGLGHLTAAREAATAARPDLAEALDEATGLLSRARSGPAERFQQTTGSIMAKGVEDSAFYRVSRLASLTEVGADPSAFALTVEAFHRLQAERLVRLPHSLTALSTHDTKRGEDTRARIAVLAELPEQWKRFLIAVRERVAIGDGSLENLLWQSIVGAWPASRERMHAYALKAAREAGASTSWADPDADVETALAGLVDAAFDDEGVRHEVLAMTSRVEGPGAINGLGAKLVQLTMPGIPDVYQGSERWERSLVDPDNRRPVEFEVSAGLLARLDAGWLPEVDSSGATKVLVTSRALRLRRDRPELFAEYWPVAAEGPQAGHLLGFDRGGATTLATRLPAGLERAGGWGETTVELGDELLRDELTGREHCGRVRVAAILSRYPVALLAVPR